tara:strand:- start:467 stop:568 length:102 start_codon:yes stop_codon:yes gene_type:complete
MMLVASLLWRVKYFGVVSLGQWKKCQKEKGVQR